LIQLGREFHNAVVMSIINEGVKILDVSLIAKLKKEKDFFAVYSKGDEKKLFNVKGLLFYSICNNDLDTRYRVSNFLIDEGSDVSGVNEEGETLLHIIMCSYFKGRCK
jgi:hypothetical protein